MFHYRSPDRIIYDEEYTDRLIRENYADIYAYCFRHLGHRETAEDLTQETFLRFLRNVERYREYGKIKNYLYVVAGNVIRDHYRKHKEIPVEQEFSAERDPMPDMAVEYAAERVGVREALAALESPDREIVILRYYQELKLKDIAVVMGMPASTVRYRLKAAEKELRRRLEKGGAFMFITLFRKECAQTAKSLIYWMYVACLVLFFNSQLGNMHILTPPQEGQEDYLDYGYQTDITEQDIMETGTGSLVWAYYYDNYTTYPVGFAKSVSLDEEEKEEIGDIIYDLTGLKPEDLEADIAAFFEIHDIQTTQYEVKLKDGLTYEKFLKYMERVAKILGPGSGYTEEMLRANVQIPVDYEGAAANYRDLTEKDGLTGGYTKLFCDYMGVVLGILPVFVTATRMLRDKRSRMQELIYARRVPSGTVMGSRYLALVCMHMLPVVILSVIPTVNCIRAGIEGVNLDYLAWMKYDLGWLLPMVMAVVSVGIFCTELTETALAVLVQAVWWFVSLMTGGTSMYGGRYACMLTDYETKYWILGAGIVLMVCGVLVFRRRR